MNTVRITDAGGNKPTFVQWDVDRVLYVSGVASQPCLHFANAELKRAIVVEATDDNGRWKCLVPNFILQYALTMVVSVFVQPEGGEGRTVAVFSYGVRAKKKPQDYTYEENIGYTNWVNLTAEIRQMLESGELRGEPGPTGATGPSGVYLGDTAPADDSVNVWISPNGSQDDEIEAGLKIKSATGRWVGIPSIKGEKGEPGGGGSLESAVHWIPQGMMRAGVHTFQGWAHCIRYDKQLQKAIGIVMGGAGAHTNSLPLYRVFIDDDGYMSDYEQITIYDTDGETEYTPTDASGNTAGYISCLCQLEDGSYITQFQNNKTEMFKSTDKCLTFVRYEISGITVKTQLFGMTQLSSGRIITGCNGRYVNSNRAPCLAYSDDDGVTWTETAAFDVSVLGNPPFEGDSSYEFAELCIIELQESGTLLAIGRASNNAKNSSGVVRGHKERAIVSYSYDQGETWTQIRWSTSILDMTGCNASYAFANGVYHVALSTRYTYTQDTNGTRRYSAMLYHWATEEDALNDNWSEAQVIDYGHWTAAATTPTDSGYPSTWADKSGNLHTVWYDGDGSCTAAGANWRMALGSISPSYMLRNDGRGSTLVGYTQKATEDILDAQRRTLMSYIADLYEKMGEFVPSGDDYDGSVPISSGLLYYWHLPDSTTWNDLENGKYAIQKAKAQGADDLYWLTAPNGLAHTRYPFALVTNKWAISTEKYNLATLAQVTNLANYSTTNPQNKLSDLGIDSEEGFTIEGCGYITNTNHSSFVGFEGLQYGKYLHTLPIVSEGSRAYSGASKSYVEGYHSCCMVITPTGGYCYVDGTLANQVSYNEGDYAIIMNGVININAGNYIRSSIVRIYNRPLTAVEALNNHIYNMAYVKDREAEMSAAAST